MQKQLLVIDDEPKVCKALTALFVERGFRVSTASSGQDGLDQIARTPADIVLLDLKLPDSSGLDILSELKSRFPNLRIVVISGAADQKTIQQAMERGASDYLPKPFDFDRCFYVAMGIETADITLMAVPPEALAKVPAAVAQRYNVLPVEWREGVLKLAMADPLDVQRLDELKTILACEVKPLAVTGGDLTEVIRRTYGMGAELVPNEGAPASAQAAPAPATVRERAVEDASGVIGLVNDLLRHAHLNRATDLHLGNGPEGPWIRERIDGILYEVPVAKTFRTLYLSVVSRIKVMAGLDIAEHRLPQDGRIWSDIRSTKLDLRVSVLPTPHGENVAIRLIEPSRLLHVDQLGFNADQLRQVETLLAKPTGSLIVTGPTGSGKSTTLYAFLSKLNTGKVNIVTIEDPVEHELAGLTQIQVHPKTGLTFATGLRSILRHDPNIIMVGEIRDQETASLAIRSSLTGHQVLSTLHTNDAASGVTRLLDLGIEPFLLCSTVTGLISQRLVRRLCASCREPVDVEAASLSHVGITLPSTARDIRVWRARGCKECRQTGYHGRVAVFEVLLVDHHVRSLIIKRTSSTQIRQSAMANGMQSLMQTAWENVRTGVTSLEELIRILPPEQR